MLVSLYRRCCILIHISLKFVPKDLIGNTTIVSHNCIAPYMEQPLSEPMMACFTDAYTNHSAPSIYMIWPLIMLGTVAATSMKSPSPKNHC